MTVAWGLLSTARINRLVLAGAEESDRVAVIAVASRDASRAEAYAREHGIERAYGSYDALLADADVDAVYISLPNSLHVEWTLRALEAGKHVLCEKPFSRRPEEVEQAFDRAESAGLVLSEGFMWRHHPQTGKLRELIAEGAIGRLRLVRAAFSFQLAAVHGADDARFRPELDGGSLMDVGSYCVNAIRLLAGEPEHVQGSRSSVRAASTSASPRRFDCRMTYSHTSTAASSFRSATSSRWWARTAASMSRIRGTSDRPASSSEATKERSASPSRPRTPTGSSSRTSATRSVASRRCCSGAPTRSGRLERSTPSTARQKPLPPFPPSTGVPDELHTLA